MNADELLTALERRGFQVHLADGALRVDPFPKLTPAERAAIAEVARDKDARSTLERLLRERAEKSKVAKPAAKISESDALLIHEAQRKLPGSPLVGLGSPGPRRRKDRAQSAAVETLEAHRFDEVAGPPTQNEPAPAQSDSSTVKPVPVTLEIVPREVVEPSTQDETARLALEIDSPESEAPTADSNEEQSTESSVPAVYEAQVPSSPEPDEEPEADRSKRILLWVTADIVRSRRTGRYLLKLKVSPSPSTQTNGERPIQFCIEESASSAVHRYKPFKGPENLGRGFRLVSPAAALRVAIEW